MARPRPLSEEQIERYRPSVLAILEDVAAAEDFDTDRYHSILRRHPRDGNSTFSKGQIVRIYRRLCEEGELSMDETLLRRIQRKPIRTMSGVAPVTVLTKPHPCPGKCIFCPTDVRMPKSYLPDEPGAMRAEQHAFDPFDQTAARIEAFEGNGHGVDKIELLVLGGTWSSYPRDYQKWFVQRCFDAMNGSESATLEEAQLRNESARHRNVGLVLETRQDHITPAEIRRLRELGATKIQMGAQSLDDRILDLNARGHSVEDTRRAMGLLRAAGFKLVLHWMPNLHGATVESDYVDFQRLFDDEALRPDELKIYSTSLLANAELYDVWKRGEYVPYEDDALVKLVSDCKTHIPEYCRVNRIYRDIPSTNIVAGCKMTNLRQAVGVWMEEQGQQCRCIRCREMHRTRWSQDDLALRVREFRTRHAAEQFLSFEREDDRIAGYLRLSLPDRPGFAGDEDLGMPELIGAAMIREIHVYGPSTDLGNSDGSTQHRGLGKLLIEDAEGRAREAGFQKMAVIAAVGTRGYYSDRGYHRAGSYMIKTL